MTGKISEFGSLNSGMLLFYFGTDSGYDYSKYVEDLNLLSKITVEFNSVEEVNELIERIDNNILVRPETEKKNDDEDDDEWY